MKSVYRRSLGLSFFLIIGFCLYGCAVLPGVVRKLNPLDDTPVSGASFKKKVGIMPMVNLTEYQEPLAMEPFESEITGMLISSCSSARFIQSTDMSDPSFLSDPPKTPSGSINGLELALKARQLGFNQIVMPVLVDIHHEKKSSWLNWLRDDKDLLWLSVKIEVYDTYTGAKILHDTFDEERKIKQAEGEKMTVPQIMEHPDFLKMRSEISETVSKTICRELNRTPWTGFIVSVDGKNGVLSSGADVGIAAGKEFLVYKPKGVITGYGNLPYVLPGPVVDELKVTETSSDQAKVVSLSGKPLEPDMIVQAK